MNALQPWAFFSSCVLSQIFVSNQPSTPAGPNVDHSTSLLSKFTWPQVKKGSMVVVTLVFGWRVGDPIHGGQVIAPLLERPVDGAVGVHVWIPLVARDVIMQVDVWI